jgi:Transposase DDE domain group 1
LLRETDRKIGLLSRLVGCFVDHRDPERIEHFLRELLAQRIYGLALGYEDLNDHEELRRDPLLALLAGKSTLNRLELTPAGSPLENRRLRWAFGRSFRDSVRYRNTVRIQKDEVVTAPRPPLSNACNRCRCAATLR